MNFMTSVTLSEYKFLNARWHPLLEAKLSAQPKNTFAPPNSPISECTSTSTTFSFGSSKPTMRVSGAKWSSCRRFFVMGSSGCRSSSLSGRPTNSLSYHGSWITTQRNTKSTKKGSVPSGKKFRRFGLWWIFFFAGKWYITIYNLIHQLRSEGSRRSFRFSSFHRVARKGAGCSLKSLKRCAIKGWSRRSRYGHNKDPGISSWKMEIKFETLWNTGNRNTVININNCIKMCTHVTCGVYV